ncbi:MAG: DNA primase [Bacteroidales bacterium]|nr:DNA primase [Bacteroidales bacterium]
MIDQQTKERIMDAVQIEQVVGEFVQLKKRGANYTACCPFHNEKTPSFYVTPSKGIFKCFGCGKSGDAITFLMEHEHYSYLEALRYLAQKYHIEIQEKEETWQQREQKSERDALYNITEFAQKYFADLLYNDEMGRAVGLAYLHGRGMNDDIIHRFGLGFCLDEWSGFTDHARKNGYSDDMLQKSGLTVFHDDGKCYDRFRGRVMFPLYNLSGRVIGFSGRILKKDDKTAKYVNSPESEIYTKGKNLYGLYQARNAIGKQDKCYLVEGNIDVASMHQSGVMNTVASWGTALTVDQIRQIKRFTANVTVLYDGDAAGVHATLRAVDMLYKEGMHVRVALFPEGEDPDSYAQKNGSVKLQEFLLRHEENFIAYRLRLATDEISKDPIRKAEIIKEIMQTVALVPDLIERSEYVSLCASKFGIAEQTLQTQLAMTMAGNARKAYEEEKKKEERNAAVPFQETNATQEDAVAALSAPTTPRQALISSTNPNEGQERKLISLLVNSGKKRVNLNYAAPKEEPEMTTVAAWIVDEIEADMLEFENAQYESVYKIFSYHRNKGGAIDGHYLMMADDPQVRNLVASLMMEEYEPSEHWKDKHIFLPTYEERLARDVDESLMVFKQRKLERLMADNARRLEVACKAGDEIEMVRLLTEKMKMDKMKQEIGKMLNRVIMP